MVKSYQTVLTPTIVAHRTLDVQEMSHENISQNEGSHRPQTSLQAQQTISFCIVSHRTGEIILCGT